MPATPYPYIQYIFPGLFCQAWEDIVFFVYSAVARFTATFGPVHTSVYRFFAGNIKFKGEACMNYTTNYHLPQWDENDRIMGTDFNQMCADMEAGLNANADAAEEAKTEALKLPYVVGTYTGDDAKYRNIDVGFRPRFVIICDNQKSMPYSTGGAFAAGPNQPSLRLYMTDTGFLLDSTETQFYYPEINRVGHTYDYIAFR